MSIPPHPFETGWPRDTTEPFESAMVIRCVPEQVEVVRAQLPWDVSVEPLRDGKVRLNSGWLVGRVWQPAELRLVQRLQEQGHILDWRMLAGRPPERPIAPGSEEEWLRNQVLVDDEPREEHDEGGIITRAKSPPMTPPEEHD